MGDEVCLAERRKKQKWSSDPRGNSWSKDKDKFGYRMLEKMGWSDGAGLGAEQDGSTSHVKISFKNNTLGLGTTTQHADDWIEHQSGFDGLLASLQQHQPPSEPSSAAPSGRSSPSTGLQAKAQKSRARINYTKYLRGKDTSGYSKADMSCILGQRPACTEASSTKVDNTATSRTRHRNSDSSSSDGSSSDSDGSSSGSESSSDAGSHDPNSIHTTTSGQSVQDYFAAKMAKLQQSNTLSRGSSSFITATMGLCANGPAPPSAVSTRDSGRGDALSSPPAAAVAHKRKHRHAPDTPRCSDSEGDAKKDASPSDSTDDDTKAPKKKKKKKKSLKSKKSRKETAAIAESKDASEDEPEEPESPPKAVKKKKKKSHQKPVVKDDSSAEEEEEAQAVDSPKKKKKKKKKSHQKPVVKDESSAEEEEEEADSPKKSKKSKKSRKSKKSKK